MPENTVRLLTCCVLALGHTNMSCKCCPVKKFPSTSRLCQSATVGNNIFYCVGRNHFEVQLCGFCWLARTKTISYKKQYNVTLSVPRQSLKWLLSWEDGHFTEKLLPVEVAWIRDFKKYLALRSSRQEKIRKAIFWPRNGTDVQLILL